jgi:hypothetical protein
MSLHVVLHLWEHTLVDLKSLGIQTLYPSLTSGSIHHIETRMLQCVLLKIALLLNVRVVSGVSFNGICDSSSVPQCSPASPTCSCPCSFTCSCSCSCSCATPTLSNTINLDFDMSIVSEADRALIESTDFDALFGADGEHSRVAQSAAFEKKAFRGGLSIGITANFVNHASAYERTRPEFAIARHFHQRKFAGMLPVHHCMQ